MSVYVDLYGITEAGTDVAAIMITAKAKVTMKVPNENVSEEAVIITLYENGAPSTNEKAQFTNANGEKTSIIKELKYHTDTKTVEAIFDLEYQAVEGVAYTLSFDVKATDDAYNKYAESGYDKYISGEKVGQIIVGDKDTDYIGTNPVNATSVDKPGFHSNDAAKATYDHNGKQEEEIYPHPVIQVAARVDIVKIDEKGGALENARFNLYDNRYDPKKTLEENTAYLIKKDLQSKKRLIQKEQKQLFEAES